MQFNQTNNNLGDVNNAIAEKGNVVQMIQGSPKAGSELPANLPADKIREENVSERLPRTDSEAEMLAPVVVELLHQIPEKWSEFNSDDLTATKSRVLFLLVAAGLVERRCRLRLRMLNHPTMFEATFAATGEYGAVEAMKPLVAELWGAWQGAYQEWKKGDRAEIVPVHCVAAKPEEWRLTTEGLLARGDVDGTNPDGNRNQVFDFIFKRGFYGPGHWLRIMAVPELVRRHEKEIKRMLSEGRDLKTLSRPAVSGEGRLIAFQRIEEPAGTEGIAIPNANDGAPASSTDALAKMLGTMFEAISKGQPMGQVEQSSERRKCQILFLAANPEGTKALALDEECREIEQKVGAADHRDALALVTKWAVRPDDLLQYLNQFRPQVVHFSGHGSSTEEIVLMNNDRQPKPIGKDALKCLFATLKDNIRLVVLNACFSRPQAEAIVEVIDCAIGMKRAIGDKAAITFAASFYRAVGFGRTIQQAFDQGKAALLLEGIPEQDTPELLVRPGVDPNTISLVRA